MKFRNVFRKSDIMKQKNHGKHSEGNSETKSDVKTSSSMEMKLEKAKTASFELPTAAPPQEVVEEDRQDHASSVKSLVNKFEKSDPLEETPADKETECRDAPELEENNNNTKPEVKMSGRDLPPAPKSIGLVVTNMDNMQRTAITRASVKAFDNTTTSRDALQNNTSSRGSLQIHNSATWTSRGSQNSNERIDKRRPAGVDEMVRRLSQRIVEHGVGNKNQVFPNAPEALSPGMITGSYYQPPASPDGDELIQKESEIMAVDKQPEEMTNLVGGKEEEEEIKLSNDEHLQILSLSVSTMTAHYENLNHNEIVDGEKSHDTVATGNINFMDVLRATLCSCIHN